MTTTIVTTLVFLAVPLLDACDWSGEAPAAEDVFRGWASGMRRLVAIWVVLVLVSMCGVHSKTKLRVSRLRAKGASEEAVERARKRTAEGFLCGATQIAAGFHAGVATLLPPLSWVAYLSLICVLMMGMGTAFNADRRMAKRRKAAAAT